MPLNDRDRRALKIGGIIAAVLVVGLLALGQLGKGGTAALPPISIGPSTSIAPSGGPTTGPTVGPSGSPSGEPTGGPSPSPIFSGRDPFSIPPQFQATAPPTDGTSPPPTDGTSPPPTDGTSPPPTSPPTAPSNGASTVIDGHTVVLLDTFTNNGVQMAQVEVDGTVYNVAEGDSFSGGTFELRDVAGNCATFLYGDESFTLCFTPSK
jgi:hypothetical protein